MKVSRYMSAREYGLFMKGKTIRPLHDCSKSMDNTMQEPSICFFPWSKNWEDECMKATAYGREIIEERLVWTRGGGYEVIFDINSKRLTKGTGWYGDRPTPEYYMTCYNRRTVRMVKAIYYPQDPSF